MTMKSLCRAVIGSACFLELSDDGVVDPDSAVKALEDIAATLRAATKEEKEAFLAACSEEADRLGNCAEYSQTAKFVKSLPDALGL
jgi:hypothetical protein